MKLIIRTVLTAACLLVALFSVAGAGFSEVVAYQMTGYQSLAETGLYEDFEARMLADGVREYEPRYPLFSNALEKRRFISLPEGTSVTFVDLERWSYPVGTKIWKEFALPTADGVTRVETRYMEKTTDGWAFGVYVWDPEQSTASLWNGTSGTVALPTDLSGYGGSGRHSIPSYSQCVLCHDQNNAASPADGTEPVLGFTSFQLERAFMQELVAAASLEDRAIPAQRHRTYAATTAERDVIGYLHGNCGHCHNPRRPDVIPGAGNPSFVLNYNLETHTSRERTNVVRQIGRPYVARPAGIPDLGADARLIKPGRPELSMIFQRMTTTHEEFRMPLVGIEEPDEDFINGALRVWITRLR